MASEVRYDGKVAIITGAGNGLGRSHALLLASRGARVVVNDLGGDTRGGGKSSAAADAVVEQIRAAGGEAVANYDSVEDGAKIVQTAIDAFGRVDIVINNAGILRDVTFAKMTDDDWSIIQRVHMLGAFRVTHAAWPYMRDQGYGRIIMTASAAGIYGNFGQANYAAAKLGLVGFASTLALEGKKRGVHVNTIAPIAGSRMTESVMPKELIDALKPELVSPLVAWLCHESCDETGGLFELGGGFYSKLRWERSEGVTFRLGREVSVEALRDRWRQVVDFGRSEHPAEITAALQPVVANVQAGPSRGGNEFIDVDLALGHQSAPVKSAYTEHDLALYALGIGAAQDPLESRELRHVYELHRDGFVPFPSYAVIPGVNAVLDHAKDGQLAPGLNFGLDRLLHGEQYTELYRPLPRSARLTHTIKVKDIFDKGKHATIVFAITSVDERGEPLMYNELTALIRGAGGWGGDRGPTGESNVPPDRAPDAVVTEQIHPNQALLYRLSGDWNPLHADPGFAAAFGFPRPILHGLCTFGYAARAVLGHAADDPQKFKSIKVRFAESVFPGETLITEIWRESPTRVVFRARVKERDKVVISNAAIELFDQVPSAAPAPKPAAAAPATPAAAPVTAQSAEPNSTDVFTAIGQHLAANPELAKKVNTVFQFKLTGPDSAYTIDLKQNNVSPGTSAAAECTLEITDADFMAMCAGKANAQELYFGGKLKITGNVMASQKLNFLSKLDPKLVLAAAKARAGAGAGSAAQPAAAAPVSEASAEPISADIFTAMGAYLEANPELAKKVNVVYLFKLSGPDGSWTVDLKQNKVSPGTDAPAECTLELSDADFMGMCAGKLNPQELYFGGKLKISGNLMASQKLTFLQKIEPARVLAAAKARVAGGAPAHDLLALARGEASPAQLFQFGKLRVDGDLKIAHRLGFLHKLI
jgi:3-hydroxyacyl-CoA dehydrogenase/3a,7a,12a-trihydroxy-5b-cholest-24-enoyl-CoA hydratase